MHEMQASETVRQLVKGFDYPIAKADILAAAREAGVGPTVEDALSKLPDREFRHPADLVRELNPA